MKQLWAIVLLSLFLSSCSHGQYPDNLTVIPSDASVVLCLNMDQLQKKASVQSGDGSAFVDLSAQMAVVKAPMLKSWFNEPRKSGINFQQAIFGFETSQHQVGVAFLLRSESDFEKSLRKALSQKPYPISSITSFAKGKYLFLSDQDSTVLVWDRHKLLVLLHSTPKQALHIFMTTAQQSIVTNVDFDNFYQHRQDLSCWIDAKRLMDGFFTGLYASRSNQNEEFFHAYLSFNQGSIDLKADGVTSLLPSSLLDVGGHDSLPDLLPASSFLLTHVALNPEAVLNVFEAKKRLGSKDAWASLVHAWTGHAVLSLIGFSEGDFALPQVVLLAELKDKAGFNVLINELLKGFSHQQKDGLTMVSVQMIPLYAALKGKTMLLTTSFTFAHGFIKSAENKPTNSTHAMSSTVANPFYFYLNLDFDHYPKGFNDFLQQFNAGESLDMFRQAFLFRDLLVNVNPSCQQVTMHCQMKDSTQNSLHVIVQQLNDLFVSKH
ncbi:MAG: DUF4836 family protein [Microbacter sp.]